MKIEYVHASHFGNGAEVAEEFRRQMAGNGVPVSIHHIKGVRPQELPEADLYVFSSPGRMGKPINGARRFLTNLTLPPGTRYALLTTEATPPPDKKTGKLPTDDDLARYQRVRPIMNEILQGRGMVRSAEDKIYVTGLKGPLEEHWKKKVETFVAQILIGAGPAASPSDSKTSLEESQ